MMDSLYKSTLFHVFILFICSLNIILAHQQQQRPPTQDQKHDPDHQHTHEHRHHRHHPQKDETTPAPKDPHARIIIPNLPPSHYQFWLRNHPRAYKIFEEICKRGPRPLSAIERLEIFQQLHTNLSFEDPRYLSNLQYGKSTLELICSKIKVIRMSCWGYENNCQEIPMMPECLGTSFGEAKTEREHKIMWYMETDFGYVLERRKELSKYCAPDKRANRSEVSSLECTKHFTTCRGENLFMQLDSAPIATRGLNFRRKVAGSASIRVNRIGGRNCDLQLARIREEAGRKGQMESWFRELGGYNKIEANEKCDITIDKQVFFVKIDSTNNLYDYLGTFINLYATMHLNNRFSDDVQIVIWDKRLPNYNRFEQMWYAFSRHRPLSIGEWTGKKICLDKFIFAMPPKMVDGLLNRQSIIEGCTKSGLFNAFHEHVIHRLNIPNSHDLSFQQETNDTAIRVSIMSRTEEEFRPILNEDELVQRIQNESRRFVVNRVTSDSMDFAHALTSVFNSDIIIGMHETGLSYSLFAPAWASLIELNNFGKLNYYNLARLRGISYLTQDEKRPLTKKVPTLPESAHNARLNESSLVGYEVDMEEFMKVFHQAAEKMVQIRKKYFQDLFELAEAKKAEQSTTSTPTQSKREFDLNIPEDIPPTHSTTTTTLPPTAETARTVAPTTTSNTTSTTTKTPAHEATTTTKSKTITTPTPEATTTTKSKIITTPTPEATTTEKAKIITTPTPEATTTEKAKIITTPTPEATTTEKAKTITTPTPEATTTEKAKIITTPTPEATTTEKAKTITTPTPEATTTEKAKIITTPTPEATTTEKAKTVTTPTPEASTTTTPERSTTSTTTKKTTIPANIPSTDLPFKPNRTSKDKALTEGTDKPKDRGESTHASHTEL